jgi:hypothetical protein
MHCFSVYIDFETDNPPSVEKKDEFAEFRAYLESEEVASESTTKSSAPSEKTSPLKSSSPSLKTSTEPSPKVETKPQETTTVCDT